MKTETLDSFTVSGFRIRTTTAQEMNPTTGKIPSLWDRFSNEVGSLLNENSKVCGVYTNYESGITGEYDVFAAADTLNENTLEGIESVTIAAGKYLVFEAKGPMPQVCINLWGEIWTYFTDPACPHKQAFTTDFELYKTNSMERCEIEIYISIL